MSWLDVVEEKQTLPPRKRLAELFYEKFFYNDLISSYDDPQLGAANLMAILAFPGLLNLFFVPRYILMGSVPAAVRDLNVLGDRFLWLTFSMAVMGLLTTLQWDRLFPDRRDYMILGPQPVSMRLLFEAQAIGLGRFLGLFFVIGNLGSALFFPIAAVPWAASLLHGLAFAIGHWVSLVFGCLFVALLVVALQGVLANILSPRPFERISALAQSLSAAFFLGTIVLLPLVRVRALAGVEEIGLVSEQNTAAWMYPPMWFAALGEWIAGRGVGSLALFAGYAVGAVSLTAAVAVGSYLLSYRRFLRRSLESIGQKQPGESWLGEAARRWLRRAWLRDPSERAAFLFTLWTLGRSRQQRLYFGSFLAVGVAIVFAQSLGVSSLAAPSQRVLAQPYVLLFLALVGMRVVFSFPADLAANWAFRFHATDGVRMYLRGVRKAMWLVGPVGLVALTSAGSVALWGAWPAITHFCLMAVASWVLVEAALAGACKIPFTCNHAGGRPHAIIIWTFCAVGMLTFSQMMAVAEISLLESGWDLAQLIVGGVLAGTVWIRYRRELEEGSEGPVFEDEGDILIYRFELK